MKTIDHPLNQIKRDFADLKQRFRTFLRQIPGRHLSNTGDPNDRCAMRYMVYSFHSWGDWRAMQFEWEMHLRWIHENLITRPKATHWYSTERLEKMGMVGIRQPLYRTLSSVDQMLWWVFGMNKPKVERMARRLLTISPLWHQ